jgi:hypothetical protein
MSYTLKQLVSSLKEVPAAIEGRGINEKNISSIVQALSCDTSLNVSLPEIKQFLSRVYLNRNREEEIVISGKAKLFTGRMKQDSDRISYLSLEPSEFVYTYLRKKKVLI